MIKAQLLQSRKSWTTCLSGASKKQAAEIPNSNGVEVLFLPVRLAGATFLSNLLHNMLL